MCNYRNAIVLLNGIILTCLVLLAPPLAAQNKLKDPTRPANFQQKVGQGSGFTALKLQQVVASSQRTFAVIDGQKVIEGQRVGDYQIVEIQPKHVVLQQADGDQVTLTLFTNIKQ